MNIARHVERWRDECPNRLALRFQGRSTTYGQLDAQASWLAVHISLMGVSKGDRVGLYLPNSPEFVMGYLAIQKLGAIAVTLNSLWKRDEVRFALADSGASLAFTDEHLEVNISRQDLPELRTVLRAEALQRYLQEACNLVPAVGVEECTPAVIVYSSGTTGEPKGCTLSHGNVVSNIRAKVKYLGIHPEDRLLLFVPLFHCFGQNAVLNAAFEAGAAVILEPRFGVESVLRLVETEAPTMFFGPPTVYSLLLDRAVPKQLAPIRYYFSAAAPMPPSVALRWKDTFACLIHEGYGLTETSPFTTYNHETMYRLGSVGTPIEAVALRIVDPDSDRELDPGVVGEVTIRGPNVMLGYWRRPKETAEAIRGGWFHSGDLGYMDGDGYLYLVDRLKDMVSVGGLKVYPVEVENVLRQHPAVSAVAVYGVPDSVLGEQVAAEIVLKPNAPTTAVELIQFCRERIADHKAPSRIRFTDALPVSPTGKVLKRVLRDLT